MSSASYNIDQRSLYVVLQSAYGPHLLNSAIAPHNVENAKGVLRLFSALKSLSLSSCAQLFCKEACANLCKVFFTKFYQKITKIGRVEFLNTVENL